MSSSPLSDADVATILRLLTAADHLAEFRIRYGDIEIAYSRNGPAAALLPSASVGTASSAREAGAAAPPPTHPAPVTDGNAAVPASPPAKAEAADIPGGVRVKAPMYGTFYRAPGPGATPFVEVGQAVEEDSVVCIIEVMKLMNSVTAGVKGTVRSILVGDSQPVELGQALVIIEPDG